MPLYIGLYARLLPNMRRNLRKQLHAEGESQTQIVEAVHAIATVKGLSMERSIRGKLTDKLGRLLALWLEGNPGSRRRRRKRHTRATGSAWGRLPSSA